MPVVRTYMYRFSWSMARSITWFHSRSITRFAIVSVWACIWTDAWSVTLVITLRSVWSRSRNLNRSILVTRLEIVLVA